MGYVGDLRDTVDRGALDDTVIGHGVKLDNQIMIAHNVKVGDHTAMAACVGVAGSTTIGQRCTIGGASMLSGHITLADDVHVSGGTAITSSVTEPGRYTGVYPFAEHGQSAVTPPSFQSRILRFNRFGYWNERALRPRKPLCTRLLAFTFQSKDFVNFFLTLFCV